MIPAFMLAACQPTHHVACLPDGPHLLLTTTDFEVGALSALDPAGTCVGDGIASVGPDSVVRVIGDRVATAQRTGGDAVRIYVPGVYTAPETELVVEQEGNVHDVVRVGDDLWFTLYDGVHLVVTELDGDEVGAIDLGPYADADGLAEPDLAVLLGDRLYVALQRLDRTAGSRWGAGPGGVVLEIDPVARAVVATFEVGPNPKLYRHPTDDSALVVLTGLFFELDGALSVLHPAGGTLESVVTEADLGFDLNVFAGGVSIGTSVAEGGPARIDCLSLDDGSLTPGVETDAWPVAAVAQDDGTVAVAVRTGWDGAGDGAVWRVHPSTCDVETVAEAFGLDPFDITFVR